MSETNYADIAGLSWDNIQEPKALPEGTYLLRLRNAVFQPSKEEGKSPRVMFVHVPREAMEDVSSDELSALGSDYDITENKIFTTVFIEDGSSWAKVKSILEKHGLKLKGKVDEDLKNAKGAEVLGYLKVDRFVRGDGTAGENNKVDAFAAVEE
jgi:hypothetical protein